MPIVEVEPSPGHEILIKVEPLTITDRLMISQGTTIDDSRHNPSPLLTQVIIYIPTQGLTFENSEIKIPKMVGGSTSILFSPTVRILVVASFVDRPTFKSCGSKRGLGLLVERLG